MLKKIIIPIIVTIIALFLFFKTTLYNAFFKKPTDIIYTLPNKQRNLCSSTTTNKLQQKEILNNGYSFSRMITLIDACKKIKDLELLHFTKSADKPLVEGETIHDLIKSISQERIKLRKHLENVKARIREPISTKKMRSIAYYLCVLEECIQDLELVLTNRNIQHYE